MNKKRFKFRPNVRASINMKQVIPLAAAILAVCSVFAATKLIPELLSKHYDNSVIGNIMLEEKDMGVTGYKYILNADEKLYVLSNALNNRILPQSDYFAAVRQQENISNNQTQSYAFQPVYNESKYNSKTRADALSALNEELDLLSKKGILPVLPSKPKANSYEATLFSAVDILEPQKNVTVWQISFSGAVLRKGIVDCIMDAQTHKIYNISVRAGKSWSQYNAGHVIRLWAEYLNMSVPVPYEPDNPLVKDATYSQKYVISGIDGDKTIVTVGFYEGVREFFIKVTK